MGKNHGSINQAGKVRNLTPHVSKTSTKGFSFSRMRVKKNYNKVFNQNQFDPLKMKMNPQN